MYAIRERDGRYLFLSGFGSCWREDYDLYFTDFRQPGETKVSYGFAEVGDRLRFLDGEIYTVVSPIEALCRSRRSDFIKMSKDRDGNYIGPDWPLDQRLEDCQYDKKQILMEEGEL